MFKSLSCRKIRGWSLRYLTSDLEPQSRRAEFEEHITGCQPCQEHVMEMRQKLQTLLSEELPDGDLKAAIAEIGAPATISSRAMGWVMAVTLLVTLVGSAYVWRLANPISFLGPRSSSLAPVDVAKKTEEVKPPDQEKKPAPSKTVAAKPKPVAVTSPPKPAPQKISKKRTPVRKAVVHHKQKPAPKRAEVEVFAPGGTRLSK